MPRKQRNPFMPRTVAVPHGWPRTIGARLGNLHPSKGLGCVPQMEPLSMINLKVLSTAAIVALALPLVTPEPSYAQAPPGARAGGGGGRPAGGGGGGFRAGGG